MNQTTLYVKNNVIELYLFSITLLASIGSVINYFALALAVFFLILLLTQQKILGFIVGIMTGLIGAYLCLALLSDVLKITNFAIEKSIQFIGIGSLLCLSLLFSSFFLIKKYFP